LDICTQLINYYPDARGRIYCTPTR
jgi:hypothetical protein